MRLLMVIGALAGLAIVTPAAADDVARPDNLDACMAQAQGMTMMVDFCLGDEAQRQEAQLTAAYAAAERAAEPTQKEGLARSKAEWEAYRDHWCETKGSVEGSGHSAYQLQCLIRLNGQRIAELNGFDMQ